jgi:hypothetical protein
MRKYIDGEDGDSEQRRIMKKGWMRMWYGGKSAWISGGMQEWGGSVHASTLSKDEDE